MQQTLLLSAVLTPHRALSPRGIRIVVALTAALAALPGLIFFSIGAWPILGFMGLDVLAVWWALTRSLRDGRGYEEITLWRDALDIRRVAPSGKEARERLDPCFVRLEVERDGDNRATALRLFSRGRALEIGAFLNPDDKASFGLALGQALRSARA